MKEAVCWLAEAPCLRGGGYETLHRPAACGRTGREDTCEDAEPSLPWLVGPLGPVSSQPFISFERLFSS